MSSNKDAFEKDLDLLINTGAQLEIALLARFYPDHGRFRAIKARMGPEKWEEYVDALPNFRAEYESWYSESMAFLKQVLPDRVADFVQHYEPEKGRKEITVGSYRIRDHLNNIRVRDGQGEVIVNGKSALSHFQQQTSILAAARRRFTSSLFEIRQILQADLMDSEIEAAEHLAKFKFTRAAGALAGVVLERHLAQVCSDHSLPTGKKNPTIADFNELLKASSIIEVSQWRFIQHLADIRNTCDHSKVPEPTLDQVTDLINGVKKIMKTVY